MRIAVPQSSEHQRVRIEVTGPNTLKQMVAVCDDVKVIERDFVDDDSLLSITAQFIDVTGAPVGAEIVLKEALEPEPLDCVFEPRTMVPEFAPEPESVQLPAREPEPDPVPTTEEKSYEEAPVEDADDDPAEEADEPVGESDVEDEVVEYDEDDE